MQNFTFHVKLKMGIFMPCHITRFPAITPLWTHFIQCLSWILTKLCTSILNPWWVNSELYRFYMTRGCSNFTVLLQQRPCNKISQIHFQIFNWLDLTFLVQINYVEQFVCDWQITRIIILLHFTNKIGLDVTVSIIPFVIIHRTIL